MFRRLSSCWEHLGRWQAPAVSVLLAAGIELVTVVLRFGAELESTRDSARIAPLTFGVRIHHGYVGILMMVVGWLSRGTRPGLRRFLLIVGAALLLSDVVHHFLVLWPVTGSPQFDLVYPEYSWWAVGR